MNQIDKILEHKLVVAITKKTPNLIYELFK